MQCITPAETQIRLGEIKKLFKYAGSLSPSQTGGKNDACQQLTIPSSLFSDNVATRTVSSLSNEQQNIMNDAFVSSLFLYGTEEYRNMKPIFVEMVLKAMDYFAGEENSNVNDSVSQIGGVKKKLKKLDPESVTPNANPDSISTNANPDSISTIATNANPDTNIIFELTGPGRTFACIDNLFLVASDVSGIAFFMLGKIVGVTAQTGIGVVCKIDEAVGLTDAVSSKTQSVSNAISNETKQIVGKISDMVGYNSKKERALQFLSSMSAISGKGATYFYAAIKLVWMIFSLVMFMMYIYGYVTGAHESYSTSNLSIESAQDIIQMIQNNSKMENIVQLVQNILPDSYQGCVAPDRNIFGMVLNTVYQPANVSSCLNLQLLADQSKLKNQYNFMNLLWIGGVEPWVAYYAQEIKRRNNRISQSAGGRTKRKSKRKSRKQKGKTRKNKKHKTKTHKYRKKKAKKHTTKKR